MRPAFSTRARRRDVRLERRYVRVGGHLIHVRVTHGAVEGAPIVILVHGLVVSSRYMVRLALELGRDFRVFAPDLPGFGGSEGPREALDVPGLARALAGWMEALGIEGAALLGNSLGCQTIAELGVERPDLVGRAVLQAPTTDPGGRTTFAQVGRWLLDSRHEPLSEIPILIRDYWDAGLRRAIGTMRAMLDDAIEEKLPRLAMPVLVVRGSLDPIVPLEWAREAVRLLPRGKLVVLPGVAHTANFSAPAELARVVRPFLLEETA